MIKAQKVAGGNKQRDFISKESASSPTVATESVLLTSMIDSLEDRDVAIVDTSQSLSCRGAAPRGLIVDGIVMERLSEGR